ncbi:hypothetical protein BJ322DRAFT_172236 [Thelephora terrestris]|uniref:Uncharacterized protein n=1 Tax=Thelephora terrestris TaxID=56493 RepID=A0A9P6HCB0_9AGAM|nr:hypothetical protein BJ322DRAFT_172236 [Thelephora terrestris]
MSDVATNPWLWYPAELSLIGAFKWGIPRPHVTDPAPLVVFLAHCFSEQERGVLVDVPVERTMLALAGAPAEVIGDGISRVDFTQPLFFNGICRALQNGAPHLLRSATFTFLRHLDDQLFNKNKTFTEDQVNEFISGWFSSARVLSENEHDSLLEESLGGMYIGFLDSSFWRDHIPQDRWGFTVSLTDTAQDRAPPSFYRCAQNSTIIPFLKQDNIRRKILPGWRRKRRRSWTGHRDKFFLRTRKLWKNEYDESKKG